MTIEVEEWYDYDGKLNLTISWDENDPVECQFNDWTSEDFLTAIKNACDKELSMVSNNNLHIGRHLDDDTHLP